jgi:acyl-CoA synthetase (AMP-forming)/AMP-acid ligase II
MPISGEFLAEHGLIRVDAQPIPESPRSVGDLVVGAADRYAEELALCDRHSTHSFRQLGAAVNKAASVFRALGLRPLDRVAVSLRNGSDLVVAYLAAMRCGLIWVGINTNLAPPEKSYLLEDCGAIVLLAEAQTLESLRGVDSDLGMVEVNVAQPGSWWEDAPDAFLSSEIDPFGPAAIAYTSGTTGRPKGVVHSQHNMLLPAVSITRSDPGPLVQGVCLPLTILNMQILGPVQCLASGSTCVPMDRIDINGVVDFVRDFGVQRMYAPPPLAFDLLTRGDINIEDVSSMTHLAVGGAKLPGGLADHYRERFGRDFAFGYGLTEAPTSVTSTADIPGSGPRGASGRTRPQVELTIRDLEGKPLPTGADGEICVGATECGPYSGCYTTMLGYWNRPEATKESLRDGVLHTGDVGMIDGDGNLWVRDRRSDLIIRGGANVYPAEVERVIEATGLVAEASVVGRHHPRLGQEVVAFVSRRPGQDLDLDRLEAACHAQIARYKIPVAWYVVESFPRNAMGKVLKPELRDWLADGEPDSGLLTVRRYG